MNQTRPFPRLLLVTGLAGLLGAIVWLLFGVGGWRGGQRVLPDVDGSRIQILAGGHDFGKSAGRHEPGEPNTGSEPSGARERHGNDQHRDPKAHGSPLALTLTDVRAFPDDAWRNWSDRGYVVARNGEAIWLRATLKNPSDDPLQGVLTDTGYFADRVEAWWFDATGELKNAVSGDAIDGEDKPLWGRVAAFPIMVPARGERVVYLRVTDFFIPHLQPRWWPRTADFFQAQLRDMVSEGLCYGALVGLFCYNVVLWLRLRHRDTGLYVLYAAAGAVFNFVSNGGPALLGLRVGSPLKEMIVTGALALTGVFVVQFARAFLGTATLLPRLDRFLRGWRIALIGMLVAIVAMPWWPDSQWISIVAVALMFTHLICLVTAALAWRRGASHARFFVGAFGFLLLGIIPPFVTWMSGDILASAAMAMLAGSTLEMLLLSFAVADRFAETQRQFVEETEQRRAIEEAYADELAVEVRERTRELVEANEDKDRMIAVIGHDLRSPLTALTRTAEHLSAGADEPRKDIGHPATSGSSASADATAETPQNRFLVDAAQTGRQVLLLIEDLVLWARLRAGSKHLVAQPITALISPVLALYQSQAGRSGIELRMVNAAEPASEKLKAVTDLVLAQTLIRNLVANALRYARSRVHVNAVRTPEGIRITVTDDGPGLPPQVMARLAPDAAAPDWAGNGLGLRLCLEIGRALDASLSAKPTEGGGTEFSFTLLQAEDDTLERTREGDVTKL